jgi:hypothetical protein
MLKQFTDTILLLNIFFCIWNIFQSSAFLPLSDSKTTLAFRDHLEMEPVIQSKWDEAL